MCLLLSTQVPCDSPWLSLILGQSPLVASFLVLLPQPCRLRPLLLLACTAAVALLPPVFTFHPASASVGCLSSSVSPRVAWPPSTSPKPAAPSLCLSALHPGHGGAVAPVATLEWQAEMLSVYFTEEETGPRRSGGSGPWHIVKHQ